MNFYPHHIGDYLTATAHLTWLEDCAYRRLLDVYYSREQFIPCDVSQACRLVRANSKDERKAVVTVLNEFFTLVDSGWSHGRCDEEIQKAKESAARSKANGMKGGRPIKNNPQQTQQVTSGLSKQTQKEPNPKAPNPNPITNTIYSVPNGTADKSAYELTKAELWKAGKSLLEDQGMPKAQCGTFVGKLVQDYTDEIVIDAVRTAVVTQPADAASYLKATCQHASGQRKHPNKQEALEASNAAVAERFLRNNGYAAQ